MASVFARQGLIGALILGALAGLAQEASAATTAFRVTFNVPIKLSNLRPEARFFAVSCSIRADQLGQQFTHASSDFIPVNGAFSGTVKVVTDPVPGYQLKAAKYWVCDLALYRSATAQGVCWPSADQIDPVCQPKVGTPLRVGVDGDFSSRPTLMMPPAQLPAP